MASSQIPRLNVHDTTWEPLADLGHQSILFRSEDGKRMAGTFKESGKLRLVMPFDEFVYVIAGQVTLTHHDRADEAFTAGPGEAFYVSQGSDVTWDMSEGFHDVTVLISDTPIDA